MKRIFLQALFAAKCSENVARVRYWRKFINGYYACPSTVRIKFVLVKMVRNLSHFILMLIFCRVVFLPFFFPMNWIDKVSEANKSVTIERYKISRLLFADDLVLLNSKSNLQYALYGSATAAKHHRNEKHF